MVAIYFIKTGLTVLLLLLLFSVQSAAVELSGKAKTVPENGLIELKLRNKQRVTYDFKELSFIL